MLLAPAYIPIEQLEAIPIYYKWDDHDPYSVLPLPDRQIINRLSNISHLGNLALAIGCAEWTIYHFHSILQDDRALNSIEANWALMLNSRLAIPWQSNDKEWCGPVRGAVDLLLTNISNCLLSCKEGGTEHEASFAFMVTNYILNNNNFFNDWFYKIISRLEIMHQRNLENPLGKPVPRESLNPFVEVTYSLETLWLNNFKENLKLSNNPFLIKSEIILIP